MKSRESKKGILYRTKRREFPQQHPCCCVDALRLTAAKTLRSVLTSFRAVLGFAAKIWSAAQQISAMPKLRLAAYVNRNAKKIVRAPSMSRLKRIRLFENRLMPNTKSWNTILEESYMSDFRVLAFVKRNCRQDRIKKNNLFQFCLAFYYWFVFQNCGIKLYFDSKVWELSQRSNAQ